jgi:hypothetical protein
MSYRIWWLIAFWALAVGIAIEVQAPEGAGEADAQAASRAAPSAVAARPLPPVADNPFGGAEPRALRRSG